MSTSGRPALDVFKRTHIAEYPILRMPAHRAGVVQDHVGLLRVFGEAKAHLREHPFNMLGISDILLAAEGAHTGQRCDTATALLIVAAHLLSKGLLLRQFFCCYTANLRHIVPFPFCASLWMPEDITSY